MSLPSIKARRLDPERKIDMAHWTEIHVTTPPPAPAQPVPVTMAEQLAAYRAETARKDPFFPVHHARLFTLLGQLIERVERLESAE
jgi:hypothetical protein